MKSKKNLVVLGQCLLLIVFFALAAPTPVSAAIYDVTSYGATGNGTTVDTVAIGNAINAAYNAGGGEVYFPAGTYKTGPILLKSNITLNINSGATINASTDVNDWIPKNSAKSNYSVIYGESINNVTIKGGGTIDGAGLTFYDANGKVVSGDNLPYGIIHMYNSSNVNISGVKLRNSVSHTVVIEQNDNVVIDGISIRNREFAYAQTTDGIDVNGRHIAIRNVDIETGDDAICLKHNGDSWQIPARPSYDILVENSILATTANATKIGTATAGNIYDVTFRNITVKSHSVVTPSKYPIYGSIGKVISAIAIESNDGGAVYNITAENYTINDVDTPIFIEQQDRETAWPGVPAGPLYNIYLSGINVLNSTRTSQINVYSGGSISNVTLDNISIHNNETYAGTASPIRPNGSYPEATNYGRMPAYGFFIRDVHGLKFTGNINFYDTGSSGRPATVFDGVTYFEPKKVYDDFNSRNTNLEPAGWSIIKNGGSAAVVEIPSSSDKSVQLSKPTASLATSAVKTFSAMTGTVTIEAKVRTDTLTGWKCIPYINSSSNASGVNIAFDAGYIKSYNGSILTNVQSFTTGTWYTLKVIVNTSTDKYDLYINGVLKLSQANTRSAISNIGQVMFNEDQTIANLWFDNVKVY